jgi:hypothetical protein
MKEEILENGIIFQIMENIKRAISLYKIMTPQYGSKT